MVTPDYKIAEQDIQRLNSEFIALQEQEKKIYNEHFRRVIEALVKTLKQHDPLFEAIYERINYAGSFYDGLRVGTPEEFDLDLIMNLPVNYNQLEVEAKNCKPGYVKIRYADVDSLKQHPRWLSTYKDMRKWFNDDKYLVNDKFRTWWTSVVTRGLNQLRDGILKVEGFQYQIRRHGSGPAETLEVREKESDISFDVDLVPVLQFKAPHWPPAPIRTLPDKCKSKQKTSWLVVPKPVKGTTKVPREILWRLAFHEEERVLLEDKNPLKPAVKLLKKLRDTQNLSQIASYYIKTMFLWEVEKPENARLWNAPVSVVFMHMLKVFRDCMKNGEIRYYWQPNNNLIEGLDGMAIDNFYNRLNRIIIAIDKGIVNKNTRILNEFILSREEYTNFYGPSFNSRRLGGPPLTDPAFVPSDKGYCVIS